MAFNDSNGESQTLPSKQKKKPRTGVSFSNMFEARSFEGIGAFPENSKRDENFEILTKFGKILTLHSLLQEINN